MTDLHPSAAGARALISAHLNFDESITSVLVNHELLSLADESHEYVRQVAIQCARVAARMLTVLAIFTDHPDLVRLGDLAALDDDYDPSETAAQILADPEQVTYHRFTAYD